MLTASGVGTDYTLMGGQWNNSTPITFSIAPDGVSWDQGTNNVNAKLNAEFGGTSWQGLVAKALQTWAAVTNLNFTQVADGPYGFNSSGIAEGDQKFGDIRIGGYDFGTIATIARTYGPPPNGQTGAGDVELNTSFNFAPGTHYDFQSVILHELGHSLGLGESPQPSSVMYTFYSGARQGLSPYDIEGIQSLYGARVADSYQAGGVATTAANAFDLTSSLNASEQTVLNGTSLATIGDVEYFSVVAPALSKATLQVEAQAQGISLLSPKVSVIDPSTGATLAVNSNSTAYGDNASVSIPNAVAGHRYLIAVTGATNDVFSVGSYALHAGFVGGTATAPTPAPTPTPTPLPSTPTPVQTTPAPVVVTPPRAPVIAADAYSYNGWFAGATELGPLAQRVITNLTLPTASSYQSFTFEVAKPGIVQIGMANTFAVVEDASGRPITAGQGLVGFVAPASGSRYYVFFNSPNAAPVANYAFIINVTPLPTPAVVAPLATAPVKASTSKPTKTGVKKADVTLTPKAKTPSRTIVPTKQT